MRSSDTTDSIKTHTWSALGRAGRRRRRSVVSTLLVTVLMSQALLASAFTYPSPAHALTLEEAEKASGRISAGEYHSLAVKPDGNVSAWGSNQESQADVPSGLVDVVAVSAGAFHSLALMSDGTAVGWGGGTFNWSFVPPGLDDAVAISAGGEHSLILRSDGTVVATGSNSWRQCDVPSGGFSAISAGGLHSLALKEDGTVVAWGRTLEGQCNVPSGNDFVAVAGGGLHSLALRDNGTVVAWGQNTEGQCNVPSGNDFVAIAAGMRHSLALRSDGTVVAWGGTTASRADGSVLVPPGLADVVAIDAGGYHSLALLSGGTVVGWGQNDAGQCFGAVSVQPAPDSYDTPSDVVFSIRFSANALAGPEYSKITLRDSGGSAVAITRALSGDVLTVAPQAPLSTDTSYTLVIPAGSVRDAYGSANPSYSFDYFTSDTSPPVVVSVDLPDAGGDPGSQEIRVHFNEGVYAGESFDGIALRDAEGGVVGTSVTIGGHRQRVLTVTPKTVLDPQQSFTLTIPAGAVSDGSGNPLVAPFTLNFTSTATPPPSVSIAGNNRYLTAIAGSKAAFESADAVVVATGENFADALGGAGLAGALDAPLLLTQKGALPSAVATEIGRLGASKVYILGGTGAVSADVGRALDRLPKVTSVTRIAGSNRYQTAERVAAETIRVLNASGTYNGDAFIATGANFPDALGASPVAASQGMPVFLADPARSTVSLPGSVKRVWITGGTAVVSQGVENSLKSKLGTASVKRLAGGDRFATAAAVARFGVSRGMQWDGVGITTGMNFPDALAAGPVLGSKNTVMLLTDSNSVPAPTRSALSANRAKIKTVHFFGGTAVVPLSVRAEVLKR